MSSARWLFQPILTWVLLALAAAAAAQEPPAPAATPTEPVFRDAIEVQLVQLVVRAIDGTGEPIRGLGPEDFELEVDGIEVVPESVDWIEGSSLPDLDAGSEESSAGEPEARAERSRPELPGRRIVLFFQLDFERHRLRGLMRMATHAKDLIDTLEGDDKMAVVTFTSHLQVRADFTDNRKVLKRAVRATNLFADPGEVARSDVVSLLGAMDEAAARDAAWPETALAVLGEALGEIDGEKTIVVFGWGIGRFSRSGVQMRRDWGRARDAMESNRTSIFTIDVTQADDHSLAVGLKHVARQTGGMYQPTYHFPEAAVSRVSGALSGYYVLVFAKPTDSVGYHSVAVELRDRPGQALAKQFFVD